MVAGKKANIIQALYGLKSASAIFCAQLADCTMFLGYKPYCTDPDLWMKLITRSDSHENYYSYILCHVDDILVILHDSMSLLEKLDKYFKLKDNSVGDPAMYLGTKLRKVPLENEIMAWDTSPSMCVQESVKNCKKFLGDDFNGKYLLPKPAENSFVYRYEPENDMAKTLAAPEASYFQSIIRGMQ